jgi:addiction module HigA family antidote
MLLQRKPTLPGEILSEEFLKPMKMTQKQIANHLGCDVKVINRLINGRTSLSAEMAIRLASAFGTSAEFWLNAQQAIDIYEATKKVGKQRPRPLLKAS